MKRKMIVGAVATFCLIITFSCSRNYRNSKESVTNDIDSDISKDSLKYLMTFEKSQVLDVYRASYANNAQVGLYEFSGNWNQRWSISKMDSVYIIRSDFSKKVLAINLTDSMLVQQDYNGSDNQHWLISGEIDSAIIRNKALGKYLTYSKDIDLDNCAGERAQYWILQSFNKLLREIDTCNCIENFDFIKNRIETSYSGFQDKVNQSTKGEYNRLRDQSVKAAKESDSSIKCFKAIQDYLSFFHDKHIHFYMIGNNSNSDRPIVPYKLEKITNAEWFSLKNIDDSTLLLSLPSFKGEYKLLIDNLISNNMHKIVSTPYLVIDLRGNGGGMDPAFYNILPFLYTNPYKLYGNDILASIENIRVFEVGEQRISSTKTNGKPSQDAEWVSTLISKMKKNIGKFILRSNDTEVKRDKVLRNPRKVAILINRNCASSAEEFLLNARESQKVLLFGEPTSGTLDYSNVMIVPCPSMVFKFGYATTRSRRLPRFSVDRDKIQPNVYLNYNTDWITEAVRQLKR
ncbi:MAG: S41 family peptidase [Prolixibacteraceae bacterium]